MYRLRYEAEKVWILVFSNLFYSAAHIDLMFDLKVRQFHL